MDRLHNLLQSVPNDDDLRLIYQDDKKLYLESLKKSRNERIKSAILQVALPCLWNGTVRMKLSTIMGPSASSSANIVQPNVATSINGDWEECYLAIQGHRLVWWDKVNDLYDGKKSCRGQLLLCGVGPLAGICGITQTSPVDIKEMKEPKRLLAIFGCDEHGIPLKCTLFFNDVESCRLFQEKIVTVLK